jgi:hypothetical protein
VEERRARADNIAILRYHTSKEVGGKGSPSNCVAKIKKRNCNESKPKSCLSPVFADLAGSACLSHFDPGICPLQPSQAAVGNCPAISGCNPALVGDPKPGAPFPAVVFAVPRPAVGDQPPRTLLRSQTGL